ncbi:hypothetical protein TrCOL_g7908 [Triparma columacea]|uniref:PCI domain-containing protein n=1 Tax=Triparma columacea TaxID=722753 RepID=A0A9W7LDY0_9STRA|nr:hypothetical protein TrCOL_g7908 [Triparma columacea]
MNADGQFEEKKDLTGDCDVKIPQADKLAASPGGLGGALDLLYGLEKQCRVGNDVPNLKRVCLRCVQLCKEGGDYERLTECLNFITKRRSQKQQAIASVVKEAVGYVEESPEGAVRQNLVVCLRDITDGRIYVEAERASLTLVLAAMYEKAGDISKSAEVLQEVHVETYGSLSKREKLDFILEQVRMVLLKRDFVRAYIVSQKVNKKLLEEPAFKKAKVAFYKLMIEYHREMKDAWELSNCYMQIYKAGQPTEAIAPQEEEGVVVMDEGEGEVGGGEDNLKAAVVFLCLSKHGPEQVDMMHKLLTNETCAGVEGLEEALKIFTTDEIVKCPWRGMEELLDTEAVSSGDMKDTWTKGMEERTTQHNIRTAAKYYKRISGARLGGLLGMGGQELERAIASMVAEGEVQAKIDRPRDVVRFGGRKSDENVLSEWAADLGELLGVVEKTWEGVQKEMTA